MTKRLLVAGPDTTVRSAFDIALAACPQSRPEMLQLASTDYYRFDLDALAEFPPADWAVCAAVNEFYINDVRRAFVEAIATRGYELRGLVSPRSDVSASAVIGAGCIVHPGVSVGPDCVVGAHAVLRPNVVLAEGVAVGAFATLEANVSVREGARIGDFTTVCANSSISRMTRIGDHCYLNLQRRYEGVIPALTFYSPMFERPVRVFVPGDSAAAASQS